MKFFSVNSSTIHNRNRSDNLPKFQGFGLTMWHLSWVYLISLLWLVFLYFFAYISLRCGNFRLPWCSNILIGILYMSYFIFMFCIDMSWTWAWPTLNAKKFFSLLVLCNLKHINLYYIRSMKINSRYLVPLEQEIFSWKMISVELGCLVHFKVIRFLCRRLVFSRYLSNSRDNVKIHIILFSMTCILLSISGDVWQM